MFDTMTMTKTIGGLAGALLVFLLGGWAAETIYHSGGHGDAQQAYVIEVEDSGGPAEAVEEGPPFEELYAVADAAAGERVWRACQACHSLEEGRNGTGPSLYGIVGHEVGEVPGFGYSAAMQAVEEPWTPEHLDRFIANPRGEVPGTAMGYNGMRSATDRANLIAYLATIGG